MHSDLMAQHITGDGHYVENSQDYSRLPQIRIAVNSNCGRACYYCRPAGESSSDRGTVQICEEALISIAKSLKRLGIESLKLTGGDPALWPSLQNAVHRLKQEVGIRNIEILSRHPRIGTLAAGLAAAGVDLFNVSVDTLDPVVHKQITGCDDLPLLLAALQSCVRTGVLCKVNMVVLQGVNVGEVDDLVAFCEQIGVRRLKLLDVITDMHEGGGSFATRLARIRGQRLEELYSPLAAIDRRLGLRALARSMEFQGALGHPMTKLMLPSGLEVLFKDSSAGRWYGDLCNGCLHYPCHDALMALRITPDLKAQFCLLNDTVSLNIKKTIDDPAALDDALGEAFRIYAGARFVGKVNDEPSRIPTFDVDARALAATWMDHARTARQ